MNVRITLLGKPEGFPDSSLLIEWLLLLAGHFEVYIERLSYAFVSEAEMLSLNQKHLNHDTDTDIITFSYGTSTQMSAEVFICPSRLYENAKTYSQTPENELIRLMSHGFLHALGHQDKSDEEQDKMRLLEDQCIAMFHVKQNNYV